MWTQAIILMLTSLNSSFLFFLCHFSSTFHALLANFLSKHFIHLFSSVLTEIQLCSCIPSCNKACFLMMMCFIFQSFRNIWQMHYSVYSVHYCYKLNICMTENIVFLLQVTCFTSLYIHRLHLTCFHLVRSIWKLNTVSFVWKNMWSDWFHIVDNAITHAFVINVSFYFFNV